MQSLTGTNYKTENIVARYLKMLLTGITLTLAAIIAAQLFNHYYPLPEKCKNYFEYLGYVAWVTSLGQNGLGLLTWSQEKLPEDLDQKLAQIISLVGVFAFVFARELAEV